MRRKKDIKLVKVGDVPKIVLELTGVTRTRETIYYWIKKGRKSYDGRNIKLGTVTTLGAIYTTRELVEKFIREL